MMDVYKIKIPFKIINFILSFNFLVYEKKKNKPPNEEVSDNYTVVTGKSNSTAFITNSATFTKECGIVCSPLLRKSNQMQSNENNTSDFSEEYDSDVDPLYDPQTDGLPLKKVQLQNLKRLNRSISESDSNSNLNESVMGRYIKLNFFVVL